jgi:hypothetical protein
MCFFLPNNSQIKRFFYQKNALSEKHPAMDEKRIIHESYYYARKLVRRFLNILKDNNTIGPANHLSPLRSSKGILFLK